MDLPDLLSPPLSIVHRSREVFQAPSCIRTELLYIGSSWSSCEWGPQEYNAYEFLLTSPAYTRMSRIYKNAVSCIEQVLDAASHKTAAVRPPTTHHENYQN